MNFLFNPGQIMVTPGAIALFRDYAPAALEQVLAAHLSGNWGDVDEEDWATNDQAVRYGMRILSAYKFGTSKKIWIITEHDRSMTTILTPDEY